MTERLADIGIRIGGIRQLDAVVNAMRGIAAARVQQARGQLAAVDGYAATIAAAIGRALALLPAADPKAARRSGRLALVLFCAEQGFAGAFSERVLDGAGADLAASELFLIGTRGGAIATERGLAISWKGAMPAHSPGIPKLAGHVAEALYARIGTGEIDRLDAIFSQGEPGRGPRVERIRMFPFDLTRFPRPSAAAPFLNLTPSVLLGELTLDYLHALLCKAALHAFAAENEARMEAMAAARGQIERHLVSLRAMERQERQEGITAEILELAAGEAASQLHGA